MSESQQPYAPQPSGASGDPGSSSHPSEPIDLADRSVDLLTSPTQATLDGGRRRGRLPIFIAVGTVVALVLGGVAYAGARLWYGSGPQPEEATPSTVVAFARLDLSPGYGQRLKINDLLEKFPRKGGQDAVDALKQGIFHGLDIDEAPYRKHVAPWFADRVGVALWFDGKQRPYGLIMLAADDESAARAGLGELQRKDGADRFGFVVRNGYALVANGDQGSQAAADAAAEDAERESLAGAAQFRAGVDWLPGQQTALAWTDLARLGAAAERMMQAELGDEAEEPGDDEMPVARLPLVGGFLLPGIGVPGASGPATWGDLKGHVIVGAQAGENGVEIRFRSFGTGAPARETAADARSTVDSLPANSALAASFPLGDLTGFAGPAATTDEMFPEEMLQDMPPAEAEQARKEMREATKRFEALGNAFAALSGAKISIAATRLYDVKIPALIASAELASADKVATLSKALKLLGDDVNVTESGNKVELTTKGYAADGGMLAGQALYREALSGAPQQAVAVLYLDVHRLLADSEMTDEQRRQAEPVKAIGLATAAEGDGLVGLLRVVVE